MEAFVVLLILALAAMVVFGVLCICLSGRVRELEGQLSLMAFGKSRAEEGYREKAAERDRWMGWYNEEAVKRRDLRKALRALLDAQDEPEVVE